MIRLAIAAFAWSALQACAFEYCDVVAKPAEMMREAKGWHQALKKKQYAELESQFGRLLAQAQGESAGDGKAERALRVFEKFDEWRESRHRDWREAYPKSAAALLAQAHYHLGRAVSVRTAGKSPGEEHDAVMRAELAAARVAIGRLARIERSSSLAEAVRLRIAAADDGPKAARSAAEAAIAAFPTSLAVRMAQLEANQDEWGGRRAELAAIPAQASGLPAADRRYLDYLVLSYLGRTELDAGHRSAALRHYARAVPLCPALSHAASELAKLYLEDGKYAAALPLAEQLIAGYPTDGLGYLYRGRAHRGLGRYAEAVKDQQQAVDLGLTDGFIELAWLHENGKGVPRDLAKALSLYEVGEARNVASAREGAQRVRAVIGNVPR